MSNEFPPLIALRDRWRAELPRHYSSATYYDALAKCADELSAVLDAGTEGGWRDISSAPKDREVLLWWPYWSKRATVGYWKHDRWIAENALQDSVGAINEGPTHWQPLPAPPKEPR